MPDTYPKTPLKDLDMSRVSTCSIFSRESKVNVTDLGTPGKKGMPFFEFTGSLPKILASENLRNAASAIAQARKAGRGVLLGMGGHPIKVGLGPLLVDAVETEILTGIATNGAAIIHDFEIALSGSTSEDVGASLLTGEFGMAEETAQMLNKAINEGAAREWGIGRSVGGMILSGSLLHASLSVFAAAYEHKIPATVHVALGTDIIHMHKSCDGAATGKGSMIDFHLFTRQVAALDGGVFINLGSAVIIPEVFLKAFSIARNLGCPLDNLTTVNMDFIQHYRPNVNVVQRPTGGKGRGIALTGHHEILFPLLMAMVKEEME